MRSDDDDAPTPRTTGSFRVFAELCEALVLRLEDTCKSLRSANPFKRDIDRALRCTQIADELRLMAEQFRQWPKNPQKAAEQRPALVPRLGKLQREAEEIMAAAKKWWVRK